MIYRLHAIFESLQGEGRNTGRPCVFVRFSSCNLSCTWCDTHRDERMQLSEDAILARLRETGKRSVILTGGEPTIQPGFDELVRLLREAGYWVALETNGVQAPRHPEWLSYIAVSPKADFAVRYRAPLMLTKADEVRIVATSDIVVPFCRQIRETIRATDYYISPYADFEGKIHYRRALKVLHALNAADRALDPPWALSIQTHKVLGIR